MEQAVQEPNVQDNPTRLAGIDYPQSVCRGASLAARAPIESPAFAGPCQYPHGQSPEGTASSTFHYLQNLYGKSTTTDVLLKSDLQAKVLRHRLTPNLQDFVASSLDEIEYSTEKELPASQGMMELCSSPVQSF